MSEQPEKTDEELIHAAEHKFSLLEAKIKALGDPELIDLAESTHRRLHRCLVRYNRDHAGENPVALRSGGDK